MTDEQMRPTASPASDQDGTQGEAAAIAPMPAPTAPEPGVDPGAPPAPASGAPAAAGPGASRVRWIAAIGVAAVAIIAIVGGFMLASNPGNPGALAYVPADSVVVVELRPELPGDQMQQLGTFLSHFPGFADQSTLSQKLDEAFTKALATAPGGIDYMTRVKPWLNGPAFIAMRPAAASPTGTATDVSTLGSQAHVLVSATTTGQITCAATLEGQTTASETYNGTELLMVSGSDFGCAMQGKQGLLGDRESLHAALDAKAAGTGMDKVAAYAKARASLKGDQLATVYYDFKRFLELERSMLSAIPGASNPLDSLNLPLPDWGILGMRAEGTAMVMDGVAPVSSPAPGSSLLPAPAAHASAIAGLVPADALAFVETQGAGVSLQNLVATLRSDPQVDQQLQVLDGIAGMDTLVGWIQDAGLVVTGGDSPTASLILLAADEATAARNGGSLSALVGLAAAGGNGISVSDATVNGVKITTLTITDPGALVGSGSLPATGPVKVSFAVQGKAVLFGVGDGALDKLVGVTEATSLASDATFKRVAARGVSPSSTTVYVAVPKLVDLIGAKIPEASLADWNTSVKPYLEPLEALYFTTESEGDLGETIAILSVTGN